MKTLILTLVSLFILSSCSSYVNRMHRQFDKSDKANARASRLPRDKFDLYRKRKRFNRRPPRKISTLSRRSLLPSVKRKYIPANQVKKRYTAKDLADNSKTGSLWAGEGKDSFLFTDTKQKRAGDIIVINVMTGMKKEISMELKRAFPPPPKKKKKKAGAKDAPAAPEEKTAEAKPEAEGDPSKVHDRISGVVIESINTDHLLVRGRKNLLYRSRKRTVEVQALVSRRSVNVDNEIKSSDILESQIRVLR